MAASLAVGLLFAPLTSREASDNSIASAAFNGALDATPSLQTVSFASGERLTPQLSFAKAGGGYCRQFDLISADRASTGLACTADGKWTIEALLPTVPKRSATDGYTVAEDPENAHLANIIEGIRAGDSLGSGLIDHSQ